MVYIFTFLGPLASDEGYTPCVDLPGSTNMQYSCVPPPVVEITAVSISDQDCPAEVGRPGSGDKNTCLPTPSYEGLPTHLAPRNPVVHICSSETWKDRKQGGWSSTEAPSREEGWRNGEEVGEDRMLDMDDLQDVFGFDPPGHLQSAFDGKSQELPEPKVICHQVLEGTSARVKTDGAENVSCCLCDIYKMLSEANLSVGY